MASDIATIVSFTILLLMKLSVLIIPTCIPN